MSQGFLWDPIVIEHQTNIVEEVSLNGTIRGSLGYCQKNTYFLG